MTGLVISPRLLASGLDRPSLDEHTQVFGKLSLPGPHALLDEIEASGLRGRGGAGFPTGRKLRTVAAGRRPVVLANACEGEPGSSKDSHLALHSPHLVLDGIHAAMHAIGATSAYLAAHSRTPTAQALQRALTERRERRGITFVDVPHQYVASEESALVNLINTGVAMPVFTPPRPFEKGVHGRPTLVNNAETLASIALVARYGARWFREVGDEDEPGTQLLTVSGPTSSGAWQRVVVEVPTGVTARDAFVAAGLDLDQCQAVLVGGYFGSWYPLPEGGDLDLTHRDMSANGGALGAGILIGLPRGACGVAETARVAHYLAGQSAGQCGPCFNGLPAISRAVGQLAHGPWHDGTVHDLDRWLTVVPGRGACRHPDGAVRFVQSALHAFSADVHSHRAGSPCPWHRQPAYLPLPDPTPLGRW